MSPPRKRFRRELVHSVGRQAPVLRPEDAPQAAQAVARISRFE